MKNLFLGLTLVAGAYANAQNINTVFGGGSSGPGDGGPASASQLTIPRSIAQDASGNIYIVETNGARIRKVAVSTGIITTVAGTGSTGFTDNVTALSAQFNAPWDLIVDGAGDLLIADRQNNRIRKMTMSTGMVTTIAGITPTAGPNGGYNGDNIAATSAKIFGPVALALDASGNIYFADYYNNRIRKITVATGIITTVAGTGTNAHSGDGGPATAAGLGGPLALAIDASGNMYIGEGDAHYIRKVNASTGIITTIAGNGGTGFSGDGGPATAAQITPVYTELDASGTNLYISEVMNSRVRKINLGTGVISSVAGSGAVGFSGDGGAATSAQFNGPSGLLIPSSGDLYICDAVNNRVRKVGAAPVTVGVTDLDKANTAIGIYPNPVSSSATIRFSQPQNNVTIRLTDVSGKELRKNTFSGTEFTFEKQDLKAGVYFVTLNANDGSRISEKLIIAD